MLDAISATTDERIDLDRLPNDDPKTLLAFQNGELGDIPYFDCPGIQAALGKVNVTFDELVNIRALLYLEFTNRLDAYLARRRGEAEVVFAHPLLRNILGETCGLFIFYEQILLVLHRLGGFTLNEAEICRRVLYMRREKEMAIAFKKFLSGCLANPAFRTEECASEKQACTVAVSIWNDLEHNSSRTFMKTHAVAIVRLAYILGYLKCH
jgi:DNA polymerase-3 subunit alpha